MTSLSVALPRCAASPRPARVTPGRFSARMGLALHAVPHAQLPDLARSLLIDLHRSHMPRASLHLLEHTQTASWRVQVLRVLLYVRHRPAAFLTAPTQNGRDLTFASAHGLSGDLGFGLRSYLAPLWLSASPWVWAMPGARYGGVLVFTLARDGRRAAG